MQAVFDTLRAVMARHVGHLKVISDVPGNYCVDTFHVGDGGKETFFGAVKLRKTYVAYHLIPVYTNPGLLNGMSEELARRMQGKSCFNFRKTDEALFAELDHLTAAGLADYDRNGLVGSPR